VADAERAAASGEIPVAERAALRLAASTAVASAVQAVDAAYEQGGGSSIYAESPLQRCFRDVHVVTQHMMVAPATFELVGRLRLGVPTDVTML
jgi:alkylation response protein AidB-like acyl-CoA dehydrogenase